ncbi:CDP-alcohol phosphatidyltransferase family protein [Acinetobacter bereziniae]|jgi:CDP-diacylglycerol--glycerol-3-phosphate 3-phosphatidyltransferase|uniref:CDP-alcohol phosphatidyltransferase family protein n=1 Tax=Acinetobacter TaxID=469 RepID=UPI000EF68E09|nr:MULTISPECIES: CDP-alcohol phosphatidyltransferase family protein [Acinetobacter]MCM8510494.1 CDP-alcohol phosphatidyltransferase family protein [Acinetobacter bereziniae]MCU4476488.1 CDP-alcohol phosphatidyltransferase family protein [Acinetobacter bereziniae]MCU4540943.1 CDP-alcohol phosphatidyltransferase family protein [Acinetobacter bereziniae]MCU4626006.1 CDP-alcohol phosphatidyltransferase family protein [Acinetobacter bereziniae]MDA3442323.1 CDP-alcohol phosphatidyltransferase family
MPSIYQLKPAFQNLLRPLVQWLFKRGVTANQVTLFAMFISLALSIFLYLYYLNHPVNWWLLLFPLWMLIRMAFNAIDGMLAREFNQQSNLGAFYNELSDVIADTALYVCLIAFAFIHAKLLLLVAFLAILSEYTGVMAPLIGQQRRYDGPMGKSDRAFWFSLMTVVIVFFPLFNTNLQLLSLICNGILSLMGVLLALTIYNRIKNSLKTAS